MDHRFSVNCLLAWTCWIVSVAGSVAALYLHEPEIATLTLLFAGAGATLHVRGMVTEAARRERAAFELGRESVRSIR